MHLDPLTGSRIDTFRRAAANTGCDPEVVERAAAVVATTRPVALGLSGWPGAGKDVLGAEVFAALGITGNHLYFAQPLKDEVNAIIAACRGVSPHQAAGVVAYGQDVTMADARLAVDIIHAEAQDPTVHARTRVPAVRRLLQVWGTDVRRKSAADYWSQRALAPAVKAIAAGEATYLSDVRFPNEVEGAQALGFAVVRLDISAETVRARLRERDGLTLDDSQLADLLAMPAESSLDHWDTFDLHFCNEGTVAAGVTTIVEHLESAHGLQETTQKVA